MHTRSETKTSLAYIYRHHNDKITLCSVFGDDDDTVHRTQAKRHACGQTHQRPERQFFS